MKSGELKRREKGADRGSDNSPGDDLWRRAEEEALASRPADKVPRSQSDTAPHQHAERQQALLAEVLSILNQPIGLQSAIERILAAMKRETGFDAVGIRLKDGNDYPYFVQNGFDDDFVAVEGTLGAHTKGGDVCKDESGNVCLECTCGLVLSGRADPGNPLFTPGGSFWTNDTQLLPQLPTGQDPLLNPRNRCIHDGFRSVALIPVRTDGEIVGLLQFNDRRTHCFTLDTVLFYEGISDSIGIALTRKQAEEALRQSEERFMALFETSRDAIMTLEPPSWRFTSGNPATVDMFGAENEEDFVSQAPWQLSPNRQPDGRNSSGTAREMIETAMREGSHVFEWTHRRIGGSTFPATVLLSRMELAGKAFLQATVRDISEQKRTERELHEQRRLLYHMERVQTMGELASSLAHEVSQPLSGILSNAQAAQRFLDEPAPNLDQVREILADIVADDKRAGEVLGRMRTMVRKEAPAYASFSINESIRGTVAVARADLCLRGMTVALDLDEGVPNLSGDKTQVEQVILNLVLNAAQAVQGMRKPESRNRNALKGDQNRERRRQAERGATIVVSTVKTASGQVTVSVRDSGPGISAEAMPRLFETFFTTKAEGIGMGLPICRSIVRAHEGRIWAENHPDGGAVVVLTLNSDGGGRKGTGPV